MFTMDFGLEPLNEFMLGIRLPLTKKVFAFIVPFITSAATNPSVERAAIADILSPRQSS